ncbi:uncharacterized protein LOC129295402 [Prosopis cineraria]|uniref:uncharacterized protein LOC129288644 n=1 Tax=Prosopis cineraria TaxID=364024 RepID=UPI00240FBEB4|nr:uncharacterized protein LOC129288644 [Prosopis cineraria]XP_054789896.1 uncharacterized protein LOC129295402 [Prosopis cineraria]
MVDLTRKKRVTDPLDDDAKARLVGDYHRQFSYGSSGSEHSGDGDGDSLCLSELVLDFLEDNEVKCKSETNELDPDRVDVEDDGSELIDDMIRRLSVANNMDSYQKLLLTHVSEAVEEFEFLRGNVSVFLRNVMGFLREKGHNAAICKTRWDSSSGVTAGNYDFIDVIQSGSSSWQSRYFVDIDFAAQFEIARPTCKYSEILSSLPSIFVGTAEELKRIVQAMCNAAKRCFRSRGLSVPPWRKNRYMQKKWFAPYRRTTNPVQANTIPVVVPAMTGANCRLVGFDDVCSEARHGGVFVPTR